MTTYLAIFDGWVGFATIKERVRSKVKGYLLTSWGDKRMNLLPIVLKCRGYLEKDK